MDMMSELHKPIPREMVKWRCQTLTRDGDKGLALAYIDARALMERLDAVVGPPNWQDHYAETPRGRVICTLSIRIDGEWISKSDGAGDSDIEGEKGGLSDAFKRAGVKWGVARELYAIGDVWVPCETSEYTGKKRWKCWKKGVDPWDFVRSAPKPSTSDLRQRNVASPEDTAHQLQEQAAGWVARVKPILAKKQSAAELDDWAERNAGALEKVKAQSQTAYDDLMDYIESAKAKLDPQSFGSPSNPAPNGELSDVPF